MKRWKRMGMIVAAAWLIVCLSTVLAATTPDPATCAISVTVDDIMEWDGNFTAINLANITAQSTVVNGSGTCTLYTNGNVDITADNTAVAQLSEAGGDTLVTEYMLADDGDGLTTTGGTDQVSYTAYDSFLSSAYVITHADEDGAVVVTLSCQASNEGGGLSDAGAYGATQTLTASWGTL